MNATEIDKTAFRAEVAASLRYFCRVFAYLTWVSFVSFIGGAVALYFVYVNWLAVKVSPWAIVATWTTFGLGAVSVFVVLGAVKLIRVLTSDVKP